MRADHKTSLKFLGFEQIFKNALTGCKLNTADERNWAQSAC